MRGIPKCLSPPPFFSPPSSSFSFTAGADPWDRAVGGNKSFARCSSSALTTPSRMLPPSFLPLPRSLSTLFVHCPMCAKRPDTDAELLSYCCFTPTTRLLLLLLPIINMQWQSELYIHTHTMHISQAVCLSLFFLFSTGKALLPPVIQPNLSGELLRKTHNPPTLFFRRLSFLFFFLNKNAYF